MIDVKEFYQKLDTYMDQKITLQGWIRNMRKQKDFGFIDFSDGTYFKHVQLIYDKDTKGFENINKLHIGTSGQKVKML